MFLNDTGLRAAFNAFLDETGDGSAGCKFEKQVAMHINEFANMPALLQVGIMELGVDGKLKENGDIDVLCRDANGVPSTFIECKTNAADVVKGILQRNKSIEKFNSGARIQCGSYSFDGEPLKSLASNDKFAIVTNALRSKDLFMPSDLRHFFVKLVFELSADFGSARTDHYSAKMFAAYEDRDANPLVAMRKFIDSGSRLMLFTAEGLVNLEV
mmetsp:Transcript_49167/g.96384  ORF Transcript_49167/g.96384 Transcript_49167/m.96384 type:complete len:214 (+) Transcript_49167:772-1413(+)